MRLNTMGRTFRAVVMAGIVLVGLAPRAGADAIRYSVTDIGNLPGGNFTVGYGLNNNGQVVGFSNGKSFLYSGGTMTAIDATEVRAINDSGLIAGRSGSYDFNAINNAGQLVGRGPDAQAVLQSGGVVTSLGALAPKGMSTAQGINASGQIVGITSVPDPNNSAFQENHPFLYSGGKMIDLTPGSGASMTNTAINDRGQVLGSGGSSLPFLWENGKLTLISSIAGGYSSDVNLSSINNRGQIVGNSPTADGFPHALLYENGKSYDLNNLLLPVNPLALTKGLYLSGASMVNDKGQILAIGTGDGNYHTYLLTPVPEPSVLAMAGVVAAALAFRKLRPKTREDREQIKNHRSQERP